MIIYEKTKYIVQCTIIIFRKAKVQNILNKHSRTPEKVLQRLRYDQNYAIKICTLLFLNNFQGYIITNIQRSKFVFCRTSFVLFDLKLE